MFNEDFLQNVIWEHGVKEAIVFCEINSKKYDILFKETVSSDPITHQELQYERDWWAERAEKLKNDQPC